MSEYTKVEVQIMFSVYVSIHLLIDLNPQPPLTCTVSCIKFTLVQVDLLKYIQLKKVVRSLEKPQLHARFTATRTRTYVPTHMLYAPRSTRPLQARPMHNYNRLQLKEAHKEKAENRIGNIARKNKSAIMSLTLRMVQFCCKYIRI